MATQLAASTGGAGAPSVPMTAIALEGAIPPSIGGLSQLARLDASYNLLSAPLPPELVRCDRLEELRFEASDELTALHWRLVGGPKQCLEAAGAARRQLGREHARFRIALSNEREALVGEHDLDVVRGEQFARTIDRVGA